MAQQPVLIFGDDVMPEGLTYLGQSSFAPPSAPTHIQVLAFEGSVTVVAWSAPRIAEGTRSFDPENPLAKAVAAHKAASR